uniref:asparagine synthase (glutamine-hydrolyzing) n=1 Tax=viral metagenome TaxID=1070528 RepID=A0A6C0KXK5_9ZZZZ|tara:strand:- start:22786 stop:24429 length:1644 start_codon:yes stop_codon:yes gene_type:complete
MCGIFGLLLKEKYDVENDVHDKYEIRKHYKYGEKRGPEYSVIVNIHPQIIWGFHRLCINGLDEISNQPIKTDRCTMMCNGEIYNYKHLIKQFGLVMKTNSDCEVIVHLYELMGPKFVNFLDGVFSFMIYDRSSNTVIIGRDPYGVRPLYICHYNNENIGLASDLMPLMFDTNISNIEQYKPGTISVYDYKVDKYYLTLQETYFYNISYVNEYQKPVEFYMFHIVQKLKEAVKKRVDNCERDVASLLSGGLDSSLISALVSREYFKKNGQKLKTYSIGLKDGVDLQYSRMVADHINSDHTDIIVSENDFINSIENVIKDVESYDTTTVRASVGNWNVAKYIKENSQAKVIFNGDGADELMGGYMYFHCARTNEEFHNETLRLLSDISKYDVLRSDKSISSHGLEPRTPFLDKEFTKFYISIPVAFRNHNEFGNCEKYLIRKSFELYFPELLPKEVLWRKKEAFSDGVSSNKKAWFQIIQENSILETVEPKDYDYNQPMTKEQHYYRTIFNKYYTNSCERLIPYFWMPKFIEGVSDASARTLQIYQSKK